MAAEFVAKPSIVDAGCWAQVRRYTGSMMAQYSSCGSRARVGHLTCGRHANLESAAEKLAVPSSAPTGK